MSHADQDLKRAYPRPPGTFRIGSLAGTDVLVTTSWFLIAALIAVVVAPLVDEARPGLGGWKYLAGFVFAVVLFGSVLLHEAAHAMVAKHYGIPVSSITLHFMGGMTAMEGESRRPREEFWIALVGPLASLGVAAVAFLVLQFSPEGLIGLTVMGLFGANLVVGVLNLVPGLPLDGGRVLKSAVWRVTGNPHRGTVVAGWGGRIAAVLVLLWPLLLSRLTGERPSFFDILLAIVIALFLWTGASAAMGSARIRRRLPGLRARNLARRTLTVPEDLPVAEAVRRAREAEAGSIVTVTSTGSPVGIVSEAALGATPDERRPWLPVSSISQSLDPGLTLPVGIGGEDLIRAMARRQSDEYLLVEDDGSVFGVLATVDVDRAFRDQK